MDPVSDAQAPPTAPAPEASHPRFDPASIRVPYGDWEAAAEMMRAEGVVVLTGALDAAEVAQHRANIGREVMALCPGVDVNKPRTWKVENLPPQVRCSVRSFSER